MIPFRNQFIEDAAKEAFKRKGKYQLRMKHPNTGEEVRMWFDTPPTKQIAADAYESLKGSHQQSSDSITKPYQKAAEKSAMSSKELAGETKRGTTVPEEYKSGAIIQTKNTVLAARGKISWAEAYKRDLPQIARRQTEDMILDEGTKQYEKGVDTLYSNPVVQGALGPIGRLTAPIQKELVKGLNPIPNRDPIQAYTNLVLEVALPALGVGAGKALKAILGRGAKSVDEIAKALVKDGVPEAEVAKIGVEWRKPKTIADVVDPELAAARKGMEGRQPRTAPVEVKPKVTPEAKESAPKGLRDSEQYQATIDEIKAQETNLDTARSQVLSRIDKLEQSLKDPRSVKGIAQREALRKIRDAVQNATPSGEVVMPTFLKIKRGGQSFEVPTYGLMEQFGLTSERGLKNTRWFLREQVTINDAGTNYVFYKGQPGASKPEPTAPKAAFTPKEDPNYDPGKPLDIVGMGKPKTIGEVVEPKVAPEVKGRARASEAIEDVFPEEFPLLNALNRRWFDLADRSGIRQKVEEMASRGMTKREIIQKLGGGSSGTDRRIDAMVVAVYDAKPTTPKSVPQPKVKEPVGTPKVESKASQVAKAEATIPADVNYRSMNDDDVVAAVKKLPVHERASHPAFAEYQRRDLNNLGRRRALEQQQREIDSKKDANNGKTLQEIGRLARSEKALDNTQIRMEDGSIVTLRERIDRDLANGLTPEIRSSYKYLSENWYKRESKLREAIRKIGSRSGFHPSDDAEIARLKKELDAGNPKVDKYVMSRGDGAYSVITKAEYDYAISKQSPHPTPSKISTAAEMARAELADAAKGLEKARKGTKRTKQSGSAYHPLNEAEITYFKAWVKSKGLDAAESVEEFVKHMADEFGDHADSIRWAVKNYLDETKVKAPSGANKADRVKQAESLGTPMPEVVSGKTLKQLEAQGKKDIAGGYDAPAEMARLAKGGLAANEREIAAFVGHKSNLLDELRGLNKRLDGNITDEVREAINLQKDELMDRIGQFDTNLDQIKGTAARSLGTLRIGQTVNWSSLDEIKLEAKRRTGVELSEKQIKTIEKELDAQKELVKTKDARITELESAKADAVVREVRRVPRKASIEQIRAERKQLFQDVRDILAEAKKNQVVGAGLGVFQSYMEASPELAKKVIALLKTYVDEFKFQTAKELSDQLLKDFPELGATEDDVRKVLAGVYDQQTARPQSDWQKIKGESRKIENRLGKLQEQEGVLRTGITVARDKRVVAKSEEIQRLDAMIKANEKQIRIAIADRDAGFVSKTNRVIQSLALLNPIARVVDVASNTTKMAAYLAQNPTRTLMQAGSKQIGKESLITWTKLKNVLEGAPSRWKEEVKITLSGRDMDTLIKWGTPSLGSRVSGVTDVPFRDIYYRLAADDYAVSYAKKMGGNKEQFSTNRQAIFDQLTAGTDGPLSQTDVEAARGIAHEWSLRQTYNNDNVVSTVMGGAKSGAVRMAEKANGKMAAEATALAFDTVTRFNKVITNVVLDRINYTPVGVIEGSLRALAKNKKMQVNDLRLISDLASKGLVGTALVVAGYKNPDLFDSIADFEIVTTEGGYKFLRWRLFPQVAGGLDMTQFSGFVPPYILGAAFAKIESVPSSELTDKQKDALKKKLAWDWGVSTPLAGNLKDVASLADPNENTGKKLGQFTSRQVLPSAASEIATRTDEVELRKTSSFWDAFVNRVPWWRKTLPSNVKQVQKVSSR